METRMVYVDVPGMCLRECGCLFPGCIFMLCFLLCFGVLGRSPLYEGACNGICQYVTVMPTSFVM